MTLIDTILSYKKEIEDLYQEKQYSKCVKLIMNLVDQANTYIANIEPWVLVKKADKDSDDKAHKACSVGLNAFRILMIYLSPVTPDLFLLAQEFFQSKLEWKQIDCVLVDHKVSQFKPMMKRIDIGDFA